MAAQLSLVDVLFCVAKCASLGTRPFRDRVKIWPYRVPVSGGEFPDPADLIRQQGCAGDG